MITIHFRVKFRAMGITFGTVEQSIPLVIPGVAGVLIPAFKTTLFNDRGVFLEAYKN